MKVKIDQSKNTLIIELPLISPPTPSSTGKTLAVASTKGNIPSEVEVNGKTLYVGVNAYIHATDKPSKSAA